MEMSLIFFIVNVWQNQYSIVKQNKVKIKIKKKRGARRSGSGCGYIRKTLKIFVTMEMFCILIVSMLISICVIIL